MSRKATVIALVGALAVALVTSPVLAQDAPQPSAASSPMCGVVTGAEIRAALGEALPVTKSGARWCIWDNDATAGTGGMVSLIIALDDERLSDTAARVTGTSSTEVAGSPALVLPDGSRLFVEADGGVLEVTMFTGGVDPALDVPAAVRSLMEAALGRITSIELPPAPTPRPPPSVLGDAELAALFPTTVDGLPLKVTTYSSGQWIPPNLRNGSDTQAQLEAFKEVLAAQGRTTDDISDGYAFYSRQQRYVTVYAMRVRGADIASLVDGLLPLVIPSFADPQTRPTRIGGKDALIVTDGPYAPDASTVYAYPKDDILWLVSAPEPELSELFAQLPPASAEVGASPVISPSPSPGGDPGLAALFPKAMTVVTYAGEQQLAADIPAERLKTLRAALATVGRTLDDTSIGLATSKGLDILDAIRVKGVDMANAESLLVPIVLDQAEAGTPTAITEAGKSATQVGGLIFYAHDDVLWIVKSDQAGLTEIFQQLP